MDNCRDQRSSALTILGASILCKILVVFLSLLATILFTNEQVKSQKTRPWTNAKGQTWWGDGCKHQAKQKKNETSPKKQILSIWHDIGPFGDKVRLHVIASLRRSKEHGWHFLFLDASIVVDHYIDTNLTPTQIFHDCPESQLLHPRFALGLNLLDPSPNYVCTHWFSFLHYPQNLSERALEKAMVMKTFLSLDEKPQLHSFLCMKKSTIFFLFFG